MTILKWRGKYTYNANSQNVSSVLKKRKRVYCWWRKKIYDRLTFSSWLSNNDKYKVTAKLNVYYLWHRNPLIFVLGVEISSNTAYSGPQVKKIPDTMKRRKKTLIRELFICHLHVKLWCSSCVMKVTPLWISRLVPYQI